MTNIEISPIFRQNSLTWNKFANIEASALNARYGLPLCKENIKRTSYNYQQIWKLQKNGFAFGAYDNKDLIGFICGYYYKDLASVSNLYVMPNYQSNGIASALLKHAEKTAAINYDTINILYSLTKAKSFYTERGYTENQNCKSLSKNISYQIFQDYISPVFKISGKIEQILKKYPNVKAACNGKEFLTCFAHFKNNHEISGCIVGDIKPLCIEYDNLKIRDILLNNFSRSVEHY